ncbi:hypothetical protein F2Q69_00034504 [Brassica cretica]|uniref:Uncharacterized protein n=1 Tax=Brassica cretica TaxID=69181 RepID=A0A8S9SHE8_BRACR|nr:hypothetical protein F2Q69_00034504 [Brassica cretica]
MLFAWICKFALSNTPTRASMCDGDPVLQHRRYLCREVLIQRIEVQSRKRLNGAMAVRKRVRLGRLKTTTSRLQAMGAMVNGGRGLKPKEGQWKNFVVAEDLRWKAVNDLTETMA